LAGVTREDDSASDATAAASPDFRITECNTSRPPKKRMVNTK
jgi:hypothetical protein